MHPPMRRRPSITLWRATIADLAKLVVMSTVVLVSVIAFAATVKPLSDGTLQAGDLLRFMLLAMVPMLAYALPFAAGFAATLVYHRVATDNEATAAHASGISHRSLVGPAAAVALSLAVGLAGLNEFVIPRFLQEMQRIITVDLARLLAQEIQRGKAVRVSGMMVYADSARRAVPDPSSGATDYLLLAKMAAVETDAAGAPVTEVTANIGRLWLFPVAGDGQTVAAPESEAGRPPMSRVLMRLENAVIARGDEALGVARDYFEIDWIVPNAFRDNPKYLTMFELARLKDHPERMNFIELRRRDLVYALAGYEALRSIDRGLKSGREVRLADDRGRELILRGSGIEPAGAAWRIIPLPATPEGPGQVQAELVRAAEGGRGRTLMISRDARLVVDRGPDQANRTFELRLEMKRARTRDLGGDQQAAAERAEIAVTGFKPQPDPAAEYLKMPSRQLLKEASPVLASESPDPLVRDAARELDRRLGTLSIAVLSKQNERMALAFSCAVMVLTGAVTALKFSKKLPLTVYLWTFFPAVATLVTISGGQQLMEKSLVAGIVMMWSGVAGLLLYTWLMFRSLARH